jgi:hypothetical protein
VRYWQVRINLDGGQSAYVAHESAHPIDVMADFGPIMEPAEKKKMPIRPFIDYLSAQTEDGPWPVLVDTYKITHIEVIGPAKREVVDRLREVYGAVAPSPDSPEYTIQKLQDALTLAGRSRELWKQRALDAGYKEVADDAQEEASQL